MGTGPIRRHTTVTAQDEDGNYRTARLEPGDEMPDWAPDSAKNNELLWQPLDGDLDIYEEDDDVEVPVNLSGNMPADEPTAPGNRGVFDNDNKSYEEMKRDELVELARERGLPVSGSRQEVLERLVEDDKAKSTQS